MQCVKLPVPSLKGKKDMVHQARTNVWSYAHGCTATEAVLHYWHPTNPESDHIQVTDIEQSFWAQTAFGPRVHKGSSGIIQAGKIIAICGVFQQPDAGVFVEPTAAKKCAELCMGTEAAATLTYLGM
jgi:hypothetical protein